MPVLAQSQQKSFNVLSSGSSTTVTTTLLVGSGDKADAATSGSGSGSGRRRPASHHSRSTSDVAGGTDGIRNLNRWSSSSTTSSHGHLSSPARNSFQQRASSYGRRTSLDAVVLLSPTNGAAAAAISPPKIRLAAAQDTTKPTTAERPAAALRRPSVDQTAGTIRSPPTTTRNTAQQEPAYASRFYKAGANGGGGRWDAYHVAQTTTTERTVYPGTNDAMPRESDGADGYQTKGHARNRSQPTKGSTDTTSSARSRDRSSKSSSQKQTLSRALQKANTAVQLDNAQNFEGAREAYAEACDLLRQVLTRTAGEDDRKKLEAIRKTYTSRIDELDQMGLAPKKNGKALPARPESSEYRPDNDLSPAGDDMDDMVVIETATVTRILKDGNRNTQPAMNISTSPSLSRPAPPRQPLPNDPDRPPRGMPNLSVSTSRDRFDAMLGSRQLMDNQYMPPPLSPRRPVSPAKANDPASSEVTIRADFSAPGRPYPSNSAASAFRDDEPQSTSWLDPEDDGGGSPASSVHSVSSVNGIRRKYIRAPSRDTEAEFDAALDAAVEAAYDDGFEPMDMVETTKVEDDDDIVAKALRKVELAKERVRQTERDAELALGEERRRQMQKNYEPRAAGPADFYDGSDSEEEERLLEQMTRGDISEVLSFSVQARPAPPRQSDSSGTTNRTWHSSLASNPPTATTASTLSTVAELDSLPSIPKRGSPLPPPPSHGLPVLPPLASAQAYQASAASQSVRSRRLSGQNAAQLKIETARLGGNGGPVAAVAAAPPAERPRSPPRPASASGTVSGGEPVTPPRRPPLMVDRASRDLEALAAAAAASAGGSSESPTTASSSRPPYVRKVHSSASLRSMRTRNLSSSNLDYGSDGSPGTPSSSHFGSTSRLPILPNLPTPIGASFRDKLSSGSTSGFRLFEGNFHAPVSPGSPNPLFIDAPVPLEPCPTEALLRPFWLMRCLYQTLAHPRGGYVSSKLFIPKDAWKVKGVKIKNVEDKISQCDLLTAALQKLERVDTCDADAVLVEMQAFEEVVKQVKVTLTRKLGSEVGNQGLAGTLFKDASVSPDLDLATMVPRSASVSGKPSSFSWRRLRSKNSSVGLGNSYAGGGKTSSGGDGQREDIVVDTLPMTTNPTSRPAKRDIALAQFGGPNQNYMSSLARLFDAAQALDQIARQVDDPGLKHANETQVGLELSTRYAADFFAFYICRFVLTDLNALLEKFIKRGTEWVLA